LGTNSNVGLTLSNNVVSIRDTLTTSNLTVTGIVTAGPLSNLVTSVVAASNQAFSATRVPSLVTRRHSTTQTVNSFAETVVLFDTSIIDTGTTGISYSNGTFTNTGLAGYFLVTYQVAFATNTAGARYTWISVGSSGSMGRCAYTIVAPANDASILTSSTIISLSNNSYFSTKCYHTAGGNLNISGGFAGVDVGYSTLMQLMRL
jgi:hypothetical protein